MRYDENYDSLRADDKTPWDVRLKKIKLTNTGTTYLSLGGDIRQAFEYYHHQLWGLVPKEETGYLLQRYHLHTSLHAGPHFRLFVQLGSGLKNGGLPPIDIEEDKLFTHQAFAEYKGRLLGKNLSVRLGRQEMRIGSGRLVSFRFGPNIRQSFDAVRVLLNADKGWSFNGFYSNPVINEAGVFDNPLFAEDAPQFWNLATRYTFPDLKNNVEVYYFGFKSKQEKYNQATGKEIRHSVGARVYQSTNRFQYDVEVIGQAGKLKDAISISAFTASANLGYVVPLTPQSSLRFEIKSEYISGDRNATDDKLQTFNAMFPDGGYFGGVNTLGPPNITDIHPGVAYNWKRKLILKVSNAFTWRSSSADGIYNPARILLVKAQSIKEKYVGTQPQLLVNYQFNRNFSFTGIYSHFFIGAYLKQSIPQKKDVDFLTALVSYSF